MKFTSIPQNFTPLAEGICFGFDRGAVVAGVVDAEIVDLSTNTVIARQQLRGTSEGVVDIAPYVAQHLVTTPTTYRYSCIEEQPAGQYAVRIDGVLSPGVIVALNRIKPASRTWLSTMPYTRRICRGEIDQIAIFAEPGEQVSMTIESDSGEMLSEEYITPTGAVIAYISTHDFSDEARRLEVRIDCGGHDLPSLHYNIERPHSGDMRIVWLSDAGTVERYTFPGPREVVRNVVKQRTVVDGVPCATECTTEQHIRLVSHYESRVVAAALAEIASSPRVWAELDGVLGELDVVSSASTLYTYGEPKSVEVELRQWRKGVSR